jgi:hypothetical protein
MMTAMVANASRVATVDLIDEITVTADPILAMTIGIDVIIATTTAAMADVTTTVVTTALISAIEVIVMMIVTMIVTTTSATIDVARMTTTPRQQPQGADTSTTTQRGQPQWCISEGQPQDQLHCRWSPSDQNQPADSVEHQGDRARQH